MGVEAQIKAGQAGERDRQSKGAMDQIAQAHAAMALPTVNAARRVKVGDIVRSLNHVALKRLR